MDKVDILGNLPRHLSEKVLEFLEPRDMAVCANISTKWRSLIEWDPFWDRFLKKRGFATEQLVPLGSRVPVDGLFQYQRGVAALRRIRMNNFREVILKGAVDVAFMGNDALVVVLTSDRCLEFYNMNRSTNKLFSTTLPSKDRDDLVWTLRSTPAHLVCESPASCLACFKLDGIKLKFVCVIYEHFHKFKATTTFKVPDEVVTKTSWNLVGILEDGVLVIAILNFYLFFFSTAEMKQIVRMFLDSRLEDACIWESNAVVAMKEKLVAYNTKGEKVFSVNTWPSPGALHIFNMTVKANGCAIVLDVKFSWQAPERIIKSWDWNQFPIGGELTLKKGVIKLHPNRPNILHQTDEYFRMIHLPNGATQWTLPKPGSVLFNQVFMLSNKFLLVNTEGNLYFIYELETGTRLYTLKNPENMSLTSANSKMFSFKCESDTGKPEFLIYLFAITDEMM